MSSDELDDSIRQYESQLAQVEQALALAQTDGERLELEGLKQSLTELLTLTRESVDHEPAPVDEDPGDEYAKFMAEINGLDEEPTTEASGPDASSLVDDFDELVGSKCMAPHVHTWGSKAHHNAMIASLDASDLADIAVKVLFINPTHQEMVPCSYYLDGDCRFDDDKCRYSHGEVVRLNELRDYREPQFEQLRRKGTRVLVKQKNRLWHRGAVQSADFDRKQCRVVLDEGKRDQDVTFEEVYPLDDSESDVDDDTGESSDEADDAKAIRQAEVVQKSLFNPVADQRLGEWEQHTRGIGSKIMQKMGYILGSGLGSKGEGRVVPVNAQVLPQGRSLDYCMELREQANGDKDLFSVEKKLKRLKRIQEKRNVKEYEKNRSRKDVFSFINNEILNPNGEGPSGSSATQSGKNKQNAESLKEHSSKNLNIASLKLSEEIRRNEAEIGKLKLALKRHTPGTPMHKGLQKKIDEVRMDISRLQNTEYNISKEQQLRSDKRKMTVF